MRVITGTARGRRLKVKVGAEVDWFVYDGWEEEFAAFRKESGLDYYISGNHFLQPFPNHETQMGAGIRFQRYIKTSLSRML